MLKIVIAVTMLAVSSPAGHAVGALARNPKNNESAIVVGKPNGPSAQHDAILACGDDCEILSTFQHSCMAFAADHRGNSTGYAFGQAASAREAAERALDKCQENGGSCTIMASECDR